MNKANLILIGGGGHCRACIDVIEAENNFNIAGIVDNKEYLSQKVLNYEIFAIDEDIERLANDYDNFLITIGSIKDPSKRIEKFELIKDLNKSMPVIVSPLAHVARSACIAEGTIVMHRALINSSAKVGKNCIINTSALIEHDAIVGDHCHISTGSIINGACNIGNRVFVGSNSVIAHDIDIADDVIIGAGSVLTQSINHKGIYVGKPNRKIDEVKEKCD